MASLRAFLGASVIQTYLLLLQILFIPSCLSLKLNWPTSNSEYVELVSGKSVQVTWTVESGDPSSFKLKLRNRNVDDNGGMWTLADTVETYNGHIVLNLPNVPNDSNYYIEADVFDPKMRIISSTFNSLFSIIPADSARLKNAPSSTTQAQSTPTPTPTSTSTSTPNSTPTSTVKSADGTTASPQTKSITSVFTSIIPIFSGTSIIGTTVTTATTVLPQSFSSSPTSASSQPTNAAPSSVVSSQKSAKKSNLGAILGGVLGGVCLFALALILFLLYRKRKSRPSYSAAMMSPEDGNESVAPFSEYQPTEVHYGKGPLTAFTVTRASESSETTLRQQMDAMSQRIRQLEAQVADPAQESSTYESPPQYTEGAAAPRQPGGRTKS